MDASGTRWMPLDAAALLSRSAASCTLTLVQSIPVLMLLTVSIHKDCAAKDYKEPFHSGCADESGVSRKF